MENPKLLKLQTKLKNFFTYFKDDGVLVVSEDKTTLPFLYAIVDKHSPESILLSISVDYPTSINVSEITIKSAQVSKTSLTHPFYISIQSGKTFIDDDAYRQWDLDSIDLNQLEAISEAIN